MLVLILSGIPVLHQPDAVAQTTTAYTLYFHDYSLLFSASNGSFCVYDGADCSSPTSSTPTQVTLNSQTSGTATVDGFTTNYWSAAIVWAIKLPEDLTVDGSVNIKAYISSTYKISGFFSGGAYGMGLVDIDQNDNEVQQFITQAPYTQGGNPFTSTPTQYSVSTTVDYTFKAGHYLGFAVGVGATSKGFTATVYFDSAQYSSDAALPVEGSATWLNPTPSPTSTPNPTATSQSTATSSTSPSNSPTDTGAPSGATSSATGDSAQTTSAPTGATGTTATTPTLTSTTKPSNSPTIPEYSFLAALSILAATALTTTALKKKRVSTLRN